MIIHIVSHTCTHIHIYTCTNTHALTQYTVYILVCVIKEYVLLCGTFKQCNSVNKSPVYKTPVLKDNRHILQYILFIKITYKDTHSYFIQNINI